jgi:hypothetical protein
MIHYATGARITADQFIDVLNRSRSGRAAGRSMT